MDQRVEESIEDIRALLVWHGWWDNHSPVEAYDYYRDMYVRGEK